MHYIWIHFLYKDLKDVGMLGAVFSFLHDCDKFTGYFLTLRERGLPFPYKAVNLISINRYIIHS